MRRKGKSKGKGNPATRGGKGRCGTFLAEIVGNTPLEHVFKGKAFGKGGKRGQKSSGKGLGQSTNPRGRDGKVMECFDCGSAEHLKGDPRCPGRAAALHWYNAAPATHQTSTSSTHEPSSIGHRPNDGAEEISPLTALRLGLSEPQQGPEVVLMMDNEPSTSSYGNTDQAWADIAVQMSQLRAEHEWQQEVWWQDPDPG